MEKRSSFAGKTALLFSLAAVCVYFVLACLRYYDADEIEHMHTAWYITQGLVPYRDFFQHHNPGLWFLLAPLVRLFGETLASVNAARLLCACNTLLVFFFSCKILTLLAGERAKAQAPLLLVLLFAPYFFYNTALEIRPDGFMLSCIVASFYYLFLYARTKSLPAMLASGFLFGLAFVFLQKSVLFLPAYGLAWLYLLLKHETTFARLALCALCCLVPVCALFGYLIAHDILTEYWVCNFSFNAKKVTLPEGSLAIVKWLRKQDMLYLGIALAASGLEIWRMRAQKAGRLIGMSCILAIWIYFIMVLVSVPKPYRQYMEPMAPFAALLICHSAYRFCERGGRVWPRIPAILLAIGCVLIVSNAIRDLRSTNLEQKAVISFVLQNTTAEDRVYDGAALFNLFRKDIHYFWYTTQNIDVYNSVSPTRIAYSLEELVPELRPRIISRVRMDPEAAFLKDYAPTKYKDVFLRLPDQ